MSFVLAAWIASLGVAQAKVDKPLPVTGTEVAELRSVDELILKTLKKHRLPGASVAITKDGRLVYARGFGYADIEKETAVEPTSLFRIASISKPFTAAAILQLVDHGKLKIDAKVFSLLKLEPVIETGKEFDPRWKTITVQQLLDHKGGFDRDKFGDPMFMPFRIAKAVNGTSPPNQEQIIRYMMGQRLDFDPGTKEIYSNFGYCLLGRVIEVVSKEKYEAYVRTHLLKPIGITRMHLGHTLEAQRFPDEVKYYEIGAGPGRSVFSTKKKDLVPLPYGSWSIEAMDSHGGWIASAPDLTKFLTSLATPDKHPALKGKHLQEHFGPGYEHAGLLDGTSTDMVWMVKGNVTFAILFNGTDRNGKTEVIPVDLVAPELRKLLRNITQWPTKEVMQKNR